MTRHRGEPVIDWCGSNIGPAWVFTDELTDVSNCYYSTWADPGGHVRKRFTYSNMTDYLGINPGNFQRKWRNRALIYNFCSFQFDQIYSHYFEGTQLDCSATSCVGYSGWWGPVIETANETQPSIKESGFSASSQLDSGVWYQLTPDNTNWTAPFSPWTLYHRTQNSEYGVVNSTSE